MSYRERLRVPAAYWLIGLFFGLTSVTAITFALGNLVLLGSTLATVALLAWALLGYSAATLSVGPDGLRAGPSLLEWPYLGRVRVLDEAATRQRLVAAADDGSFLFVRPYVKRAVEVEVRDPADPHPCWLVSSRTPVELAAAIDAARRQSAESVPR